MHIYIFDSASWACWLFCFVTLSENMMTTQPIVCLVSTPRPVIVLKGSAHVRIMQGGEYREDSATVGDAFGERRVLAVYLSLTESALLEAQIQMFKLKCLMYENKKLLLSLYNIIINNNNNNNVHRPRVHAEDAVQSRLWHY